MGMIKFERITKKYGEKTVFSDFSLLIEKGKTTVILGESGSGKTTLLNILTDSVDCDGEIYGVDKPISAVFQENRLVKNLSVEGNLKLILKVDNVSKILEKVLLSGTEKLYPKELSGGMARRVALARALFFPHKTLVLDEPFTGIDLKTKAELIKELKKVQKENGSTVIAVTHDVKEAVELADRVVVLTDGKIVYDESVVNSDTEKSLVAALTGKI